METKVKTIVTSNEIKKTMPNVDNGATRRSSRAKQQAIRKNESLSSPSKSITNGIPKLTKSHTTSISNSKFQSNLLAELSKKNSHSNYNPDVVSDLVEILGSPIKTARETCSEQITRAHIKTEQATIDYKSQIDDETKPATRSSKRLSNRSQPIKTTVLPVAKVPKTSTKTRKSATVSFNAALTSEDDSQESQESQPSQDESYENLEIANNTAAGSIIMNIKQEKEVSYTMTDDNNLFTCEMCSAVFTDRAQLLVHVPVHI